MIAVGWSSVVAVDFSRSNERRERTAKPDSCILGTTVTVIREGESGNGGSDDMLIRVESVS
jgi:hypothetical protein